MLTCTVAYSVHVIMIGMLKVAMQNHYDLNRSGKLKKGLLAQEVIAIASMLADIEIQVNLVILVHIWFVHI